MQCFISRVAYVLNNYLYFYTLHNTGFNIYVHKTRSDQEGRNSCVTVFGNDVWLHIFADRVMAGSAVVLELIPLFFCCGKFPYR